jgi:hypothetical protein
MHAETHSAMDNAVGIKIVIGKSIELISEGEYAVMSRKGYVAMVRSMHEAGQKTR